MKPQIIHVITAPVGEYSLLIPSNCILEITIPDKHQAELVQEPNKLKTTYWNNEKIPLVVLNSSNTDILSNFIIIKSLFNSTYKCYALACYAIPKIIEINKNNITNTAIGVRNNNIKYQTSINNTTYFIADFNNIESMLKKSYN
jgi:hypothetical protein